MAFSLPKLGFEYSALEPHIDAKTMEIHHTKHHQAYINKLNEAIAGTEYESKKIEDILLSFSSLPDSLKTAVKNHGGGHANHSLFWQVIAPGKSTLSTELGKSIDKDLGGMDEFKESFSQAAAGRFGSGWAWLVLDGSALKVISTANQDSPLMENKTPILGLDVWEHAYYLNYQNRRPDYIKAFFNIINWAVVSDLYSAAK